MRKAALCPLVFLATVIHATALARAQTPIRLSLPPAPTVDDPMLPPVPPPKRILSSWQEAIGYLRTRSTDLRIALDQVLQAEAQTRIALAQYLPTINGTLVYGHQLITRTLNTAVAQQQSGGQITTSTTVPIPETLAGNVQLSQEVVNVQKFDQISIDELNEDASRLSVDDKKRTLVLSLANQIVAVVTAERSAEINRVGLRVALEQLEIAKRKQALGAATGLDVVRADQNSANARAALVNGDESLHQAREALGLALGMPEETGVANNLNVDGLTASALATCQAVNSVDDRPDVAAARTNLSVAKRALRNVWYTFLPTITVQSGLNEAFVPTPVAGYPNPTWNIQGVLAIPIWDGGARYGSLKSARASEDIADQTLESLRRQAIIQVEQARRQLVVAQTSDTVARQQRNLAAQNDVMTQTAYMEGQGTSLELVTASEAHRQAELNLALADFNVVKARVLAVLALAACPW